MSGRAVAHGAIVGIAAALVLAVPARANDAAHKMAEKFAGASDSAEAKKQDADRKAEEARKLEALYAEATAKGEAERKAQEARKQEARLLNRGAPPYPRAGVSKNPRIRLPMPPSPTICPRSLIPRASRRNQPLFAGCLPVARPEGAAQRAPAVEAIAWFRSTIFPPYQSTADQEYCAALRSVRSMA